MRRFRIFILVLSALLISPLLGQFGQNIVQYDQYEWRYIQSPYFDVYFYGDNLRLAEFTSEVANQAYSQISDRLNWQLQKRVSIMVYQSHADFQQTNVTFSYMYEGIGGVTELLKNRVVVPFEGSWKDFRHVIRHELVHALINDMVYGGNVQSIISGRIRYAIPGWMNEGLADYLAGGWDAHSDMYMRDLAHHGDIPPIQQISGYYAYRSGQSLWRYMTSKYGEEAIAEIFSRIKMRGNVERGIESAIGADYELLTDQWKEYLKKQYWPDVVGRDRLKDIAHPVTDHEKLENVYNIAPSISPDGSKLAIMRNTHGIMEIVLISATDGRFLKSLIRGGTTSEFEELHLLKPGITWSPDGKKVAFTAKAASQEILYVVDIKTKKMKKYPTGLEGLFMAAWSPDGGTIAIIGNSGMSSDIYLLDLETEDVSNLTDDVFSEFNPVWSPDGMTLAFSSDRGDYPPYRFDQDGNRYAFQLRNTPQGDSALSSVEPDFQMHEHDTGQLDIFTIDRDGSNLRRMTQDAARDDFPVYAHTAPYMYYTSDRSGINNIYMLHLETGQEQAVTNILTGISDLNMASDDSRLYFTGFEKAGYDIYRIHSPLELWTQPKEVSLSNYMLTDTATVEEILVNVDRDRSYPTMEGGYDNYIFGIDDPAAFASEPEDSLLGVQLEEQDFKDEGGRYRIHPYKTRFTLDLVQSYAGYSTLYSFQGMTQFMFSDMLGNHRISIATEMQISLENSDYFLTYHLLPYRTNYYFTLFHTAYFYPTSYGGGRLRHYGVDVTASLPFNRFQRLDLGLTANTVEHTEYLLHSDYVLRPLSTETLATFMPRMGLVWDNAEWDYLHPVNGWRTNVSFGMSPKWGRNGISFQTITLDFRRYFRLFAGTSGAIRLSGGASYDLRLRDRRLVNVGEDAQNFLVGGLPWLFSSENRGYYGGRYKQDPLGLEEQQLKTIYFSEYVTPLRGTQMMELVGDRALLMNLEYRFPFLVYYFPALRILGQLGGVLFIDAATVWDSSTGDQSGVITYGWGPRFLLFGLPFQLDFARPYKSPDGDRSRNWYLTIGLDF
ncbi:MAG: PD40 domain-containing protein [Fidelibacterota bacterium]|nr:MAG: PD40 domain-containing protein [Candidatus Neomarinimicrobiota bacterium]